LEVPDQSLRILATFAKQLLAMSMQLFNNGIVDHRLSPLDNGPRQIRSRGGDSKQGYSLERCKAFFCCTCVSSCCFLKDQLRNDKLEIVAAV